MNLILPPTTRIRYSEIQHTKEEVFTFVNDRPPFEQLMFAVERLTKFCVETNFPLCKIPITAQDAEFCLKARGVEMRRLQRLRKEDLLKPLLFVRYEDRTEGTHLMIDGTHRLVRLVLLGITEAIAYVIEDRALWEPFVVQGAPLLDGERLIRSESGL